MPNSERGKGARRPAGRREDTVRGRRPSTRIRFAEARRSTGAFLVALLAGWLGTNSLAEAAEITVPLTIGPEALRRVLVEQVFWAPGERAVLVGGEDECNLLVLEEPVVTPEEGQLRIVANGDARFGPGAFGVCWSPFVWSGKVEVVERPRLEDGRIRFEVVDSNLTDRDGRKSTAPGWLWDRIKGAVHPHFAEVTVDLTGSLSNLRAWLAAALPAEHAAIADSLEAREAAATAGGVRVDLALDVPEPPAAAGMPAPGGEPPLTPEEVDAFARHLDEWDAFVTFVVRELAAERFEGELRDELLAVLLEARHGVLEALESPRREPDPVRELFLSTWEQLRPVATEIARGHEGPGAIGLLTFLAAGDALEALDRSGPSLGLEISADGLRRLGRLVAPAAEADPVSFDVAVDPELRGRLGFGPETALRGALLGSSRTPAAGLAGEWWSLVAPGSAPAAGLVRTWRSVFAPFGSLGGRASYGALPGWPDAPAARSGGAWRGLVAALGAREAHAADEPWRRWVFPGPSGVVPYVSRVAELLDRVAEEANARHGRKGEEAERFRRLLAAASWQESCWRQFDSRTKKPTPLRSPQGSVGLLQINERVWRGFYDVESLRWDIAYNGRAGAEIFREYLGLVTKKVGRDLPPEREGRVVYAAYNGGPRQLRTYAEGRAGPKLRRVIDDFFGKKLATPLEDMQPAVARCLVGG